MRRGGSAWLSPESKIGHRRIPILLPNLLNLCNLWMESSLGWRKRMNSSRRKFLESALGAPLAATLGRSVGLGFAGPPDPRVLEILLPPAGQVEFENPHLIRYDASCFTINNQDAFIMSGAFHYPRCPRALWRDRLTRFKAAG